MRALVPAAMLFVVCAFADDWCPPVSFITARSATLQPAPGVHRVLLKQKGGSYTAFELSNASPYRIIRSIPHFERQLSACQPAVTGLPSLGLLAVAQTPSSGYIFAMPGASGSVDIAAFDSGLKLVSEASYPNLFPPLEFADLNGDGNIDLIGTEYQINHQQVLAVALGTGGANFKPPVLYGVPGDVISAIVVADLSADHKPDLAVSSFGGQISVLLGNGDGTFQTAKEVAPAVTPSRLTFADLNGDGIPDLVFSDVTSGENAPIVDVALGRGDGSFSSPGQYFVSGAGVTIADLNGDGLPDIVTNGATVLFGDGKGGFENRQDFLVEAAGNLIVTDFDGDGTPDIVLGMGDQSIIAGDVVTVIRGLGDERFAGPPVTLMRDFIRNGNLFTFLTTADLNGDGIPDMVAADTTANIAVFQGAGDGSFQSKFQFTFPMGYPSGAVLADFNGDGKPDLAVVGTGQVDILLGNGDGTFQQPARMPAPPGAITLADGDFNGDGKPDLAVLVSQEGSAKTDSALILLGAGDGTFTPGNSYSVGPYAHSMAVADFNGDGKLDLMVADAGTYAANKGDGNITFLAGNGDGTFASPAVIPVPMYSYIGPFGMVAGDFNHDGKPDLALTLSNDGYSHGRLVIMLGRGDGTFQPPAYYAVDAVAVQAGDLNGDGILDLVVSDVSGLRYLLGNGDGSFAPAVQFSQDGFGLYAQSPLALADFNRDGKLDVATFSALGVATFLNVTAPAPKLTIVSAAGLTPGPIAPDSIATAFGSNLSASGTKVTITDSTGATFSGSVVYASPTQINFVIPPGLDAGPATVTIGSQHANVLIAPVAPSLFTVNDAGLAAAYVTRVTPDGKATNEPIVALKNGVYTPIPIDVTTGQTFLILFGTGIRSTSTVQADFSIPEQAVYAGPQPSFPGLDQVNLLLPSNLAGSGCTNLTLSAQTLAMNTVYVCIK